MIDSQPIRIVYRTHGLWVLILFACTLAAGCNDGRPKLYPVTGRVEFTNGDPVRNASIEFVPTTTGRSPRGQIDAEGRFLLSTYDPDDGAPAGEYHVVIVQALPPNARELMRSLGPEHTEHAAHADKVVQVVSLKHATTETTGLMQTISGEAANELVIKVEPQ